jgi:hypothetical protein
MGEHTPQSTLLIAIYSSPGINSNRHDDV